MTYEVHAETPLHTEIAFVRYTADLACYPDDAIGFRIDVQVYLAADAAIDARSPGPDEVFCLALAFCRLFVECSRGAGGYTLPA